MPVSRALSLFCSTHLFSLSLLSTFPLLLTPYYYKYINLPKSYPSLKFLLGPIYSTNYYFRSLLIFSHTSWHIHLSSVHFISPHSSQHPLRYSLSKVSFELHVAKPKNAWQALSNLSSRHRWQCRQILSPRTLSSLTFLKPHSLTLFLTRMMIFLGLLRRALDYACWYGVTSSFYLSTNFLFF